MNNIIYSLKTNRDFLGTLGPACKNNKMLVKIAVKRCGFSIKYASVKCKSNKEIVMVAIENDDDVLIYVDKSMRSDEDVILFAITENWFNVMEDMEERYHAIRYADESLLNNREFIMRAASVNGLILLNLPSKFLADIEIVQIALNQTGKIYKYIHPDLQNNRELTLIAAKSWGMSYFDMSDEFKNDKTILKCIIEHTPWIFEYSDLKDDFNMFRWYLYLTECQFWVSDVKSKYGKYYKFLNNYKTARKYFNVLKYGNGVKYKEVDVDILIRYNR